MVNMRVLVMNADCDSVWCPGTRDDWLFIGIGMVSFGCADKLIVG